MSVSMQVEGRRIYLVGNTFPIKDKIKSLGAHWDGDRKAWWIGSQAKAEIEALINAAPKAGEYVPSPLTDSSRVFGKAEYEGRSYFVVAEGRERFRLTTLNGKIDFWAIRGECRWPKTYQPRTRFGGYGRGQVEVYTTLGSLRDFIAESRAAEKAIASGEMSDGYCVDLEDGVVKRVSECDIPSAGY